MKRLTSTSSEALLSAVTISDKHDAIELLRRADVKTPDNGGWTLGRMSGHGAVGRSTESAGGVVVTTPACHAGDTGSIPGTGSCDIELWLSTLGTVYPS